MNWILNLRSFIFLPIFLLPNCNDLLNSPTTSGTSAVNGTSDKRLTTMFSDLASGYSSSDASTVVTCVSAKLTSDAPEVYLLEIIQNFYACLNLVPGSSSFTAQKLTIAQQALFGTIYSTVLAKSENLSVQNIQDVLANSTETFLKQKHLVDISTAQSSVQNIYKDTAEGLCGEKTTLDSNQANSALIGVAQGVATSVVQSTLDHDSMLTVFLELPLALSTFADAHATLLPGKEVLIRTLTGTLFTTLLSLDSKSDYGNFALQFIEQAIGYAGNTTDEYRNSLLAVIDIQTLTLTDTTTTSSVATSSVTNTTVEPPVFSVSGGSFSTTVTVAITTATPDASIRYTLDGSAPTSTNGTLYSGSILIDASKTLTAIAYKTGWSSSSVTSASYSITLIMEAVADPTFSVSPGTYSSMQSIAITTTTADALIRYTTNGSNPTSTTGTQYTGAISLNTSTTLKAIAYKSSMSNSNVVSAGYTIDIPIFASPSYTTTGTNPMGLAFGDLNGDGYQDIAAALYSGQGISILLGNGDGTFAAKTDILNSSANQDGVAISAGSNNSATIAIGDLTGDGKPEIAWGTWGPNNIFVLTNATGSNHVLSFADSNSPWYSNVGISAPQGVALADMDLNGSIDIAVGEYNAGRRLVVYTNDSTAMTTSTRFSRSSQFWFSGGSSPYPSINLAPWMTALGDFNGDGKPDFVGGAGQGSTGYVGFMLNNTSDHTLAFQNPNLLNTNTSLGCTNNKIISVGLLDNDAKPDVVAICPTSETDKVAILLNTTATNATSVSFTVSSINVRKGVQAVTIGDVNKDGKNDLVVVSSNAGTDYFEVYYGIGDGTFNSTSDNFTIGTNKGPAFVVLTDLNNDTYVDAVVSNSSSNQVTVLLNRGF